MSESFKRWYPEEIKARNGAVLTTRYIAETHYDALAAALTDCKSYLKAAEKQGDAAHEACVQYEARIAQLEADLMNDTSARLKVEPLPADFEEIGHIEDLSIAVTKLEMEREGLSYMNVAGISLDDRLTLGMHVARVDARLMKARNELRAAQERYANTSGADHE